MAVCRNFYGTGLIHICNAMKDWNDPHRESGTLLPKSIYKESMEQLDIRFFEDCRLNYRLFYITYTIGQACDHKSGV